MQLYDENDPVPEGFTAIDFYDEIYVSAGNGHLNIEVPSVNKFLSLLVYFMNAMLIQSTQK